MLICGIDEAGRGPLAGPVVVAAVIISNDNKILGIKDSKKLTENKREYLYNLIAQNAIEFVIEIIDNNVIDQINILRSTMLGMEKCIKSLKKTPKKFIIDGNYFKLRDDYQKNIRYETIIKGDDKYYEISCASILAKVTRDRIMKEYHIMYPQYGFNTNKGYGTKSHINSIRKFGLSPIHRKTFVKNILTAANA
jgi:ribonuclease HII